MPFRDAHIKWMAERLAGWARERASAGDLVRSLKDVTPIIALEFEGLLDKDLRAAVRSEVQEDAAFNHLVRLCFADEPNDESTDVFSRLLGGSDNVWQRLQARVQSLGDRDRSDWPPGLYDAYDEFWTEPAAAPPAQTDPEQVSKGSPAEPGG